jgi:hypothetical protein
MARNWVPYLGSVPHSPLRRTVTIMTTIPFFFAAVEIVDVVLNKLNIIL